ELENSAATTPSANSTLDELRPCWRCGDLSFWRGRDNQVHCTRCEPAKAHYLIPERLRASPVPITALERAPRFVQVEFKARRSAPAKVMIDAARRLGIAPATLTRARWNLGIRSVKTRQGWIWTLQPQGLGA